MKREKKMIRKRSAITLTCISEGVHVSCRADMGPVPSLVNLQQPGQRWSIVPCSFAISDCAWGRSRKNKIKARLGRHWWRRLRIAEPFAH